MNKLPCMTNRKTAIWIVVFVVVCIAAATVYAINPSISLNSPTSFPVDI